MRVLLAVLMCLALSACSRLGGLIIINNLGAPIKLHSAIAVDDDGFDTETHSWPNGLRLPNGSRNKNYLVGERSAWRVRLQAGRCTFWYSIPRTQSPPQGPDTIVQLNGDGAFYLVEERAHARESYVQVADKGFPVFPSRNSCDAENSHALAE